MRERSARALGRGRRRRPVGSSLLSLSSLPHLIPRGLFVAVYFHKRLSADFGTTGCLSFSGPPVGWHPSPGRSPCVRVPQVPSWHCLCRSPSSLWAVLAAQGPLRWLGPSTQPGHSPGFSCVPGHMHHLPQPMPALCLCHIPSPRTLTPASQAAPCPPAPVVSLPLASGPVSPSTAGQSCTLPGPGWLSFLGWQRGWGTSARPLGLPDSSPFYTHTPPPPAQGPSLQMLPVPSSRGPHRRRSLWAPLWVAEERTARQPRAALPLVSVPLP